ncbi:MAG: polysaccharide biosynthesis protein GumN [Ignavibacteria bacterium]|nr:polysaccharide biosynthesis protein GumN [Ignavibacteria bacterium]
MTYRRKIFLTITIILLFAAATAHSEKNFLWEIKSDSTTGYLLGSFHAATKDIYPLPDIIEKSFEASDNLVVEFNIEAIDPVEIMRLSMYSDTNTLEKNVSKGTYQYLSGIFEKNGINEMMYNRFKPWFAAISAVQLELASSGFESQYGIDNYFIKKAKDRKSILEIESLHQQLMLLESVIVKKIDAFIRFSTMEFNSDSVTITNMLNAWRAGDDKAFAKYFDSELKSYPEFENFSEKMIYERNVNMASKIEGYLATGQKYFVIVGAGHIVGDKGIISLLKKKGIYKIKQL